MKTLLVVMAGALLAQGAALEKSRVSVESLQQVTREFDKRIQRFSIDDPLVLLGGAQALYLEGYGAVLTAEVNLVAAAITPFRPQFTPEEKLKLRDKKRQRLGVLKDIMRQAMLDSAETLKTLPPGEQIVVGVTLAYGSWENREGLPGQVLMQTTRQTLLDFQAGKLDAAALAARLRVRELE